ncbi:MAG: penicillin acylase family protein [Solirubrobacterales bacterium]
MAKLTALAIVLLVTSATSALGKDYSDVALNILPAGEFGDFPPPEGADAQALLYDGLTPLFDDVSKNDLTKYFKSEKYGVGPDGPAIVEEVPRKGVSVEIDRFGVQHVRSETYAGGIWADGWFTAKNRALLLEQARYNARTAAIDLPNVSAIGLIGGLQSFQPSEQTDDIIRRQTKVLKRQGKEGRLVLRDIDTFIEGVNDYLEINSPETEPWKRVDVYAVSALKGQFLGQGGGDEARRSQFLDGLQGRLGSSRGKSVFNDLRQFNNPGAPTSVDGKFSYGGIPKNAKGSVIIDSGSYEPVSVTSDEGLAREIAPDPSLQASNTLMVTGANSTTGNPIMVGGPQIGYFYPGLIAEMEVHAPGLDWRGSTTAPTPGYVLIGRGDDFAVTLTSASADIVDQYVETLCGGSDEKYRYKGKCRSMKRIDAGTLNGEPASFLRTKHGPVVGHATVGGKKVAISSKRSSYGKDVLDQIFFRRLSTGEVHNVKSFYRAASKTPQTFNSFYIDDKNIAMYTSGKLPKRPRSVDPGLPAKGNGKHEWNGFLGFKRHPHGKNTKDGVITNWNNNVARGFGAADNQWGRSGNAARVDLLDKNMKRLANKNGKWSHHALVAAMNAAATQDVRAIDTVPLLNQLLRDSDAPNEQADRMLQVLRNWKAKGGSRLDVDLNGEIDHPGAAVMDGAWEAIANAVMQPRLGKALAGELDTLFSRFDQPPGGQYSGWYQYMDRDFRTLLGKNVKKPFNNSYCGTGSLSKCQDAVWSALAQAGKALEQEQGNADPSAWRADANAERISFIPGILPTTLRYTNRPSGIQQVISFKGHR